MDHRIERILTAWLGQRPGRSIDCRFVGGYWTVTAWEPLTDGARHNAASGHGVTPCEARERLAEILRGDLSRRAAGLVTLAALLDARSSR